MKCTPSRARSDERRRGPAPIVRARSRYSSMLAGFGLLFCTIAACNALTGVNDLVIESCAPTDDRGCVGPAGCEGRQLCQSDGTFAAECDCSQTAAGASGSGGGVQGGSGGASGQGGGAELGQGGAGIGGAQLTGTGVVQPHAVCSSTSDCTADHACDGEVCRKRCDAAADCTDSGSQCAPPLTQGEPFCTANCDIFSPAEPAPGYQACGTGVHCLPSANLRDATDCFYTRGVTRDGSPCVQDSGCLPGSICVTTLGGENGLCRRMCQPGAACADGSPCGAFPTSVFIAGREVGICDSRVCDPVTLERNDAQFRPCLEGAYCLPGSAESAPGRSTCLTSEGSGGPGAPCSEHTDCNSGLGCYVEGTSGVCAAWCRSEEDCDAQFCVLSAAEQPQVVPGDELGLCALSSGS